MPKKKIPFPTYDISSLAASTDQLALAEQEFLSTDERLHLKGIRRMHGVLELIRKNIAHRINDYEEKTKFRLPNKPEWQR